jgi:hypothetical protein
MVLRAVTLKVRPSDIDFLKMIKQYRNNYDKIINKMVDECNEKILNVNDLSSESLRGFSIKMSESTLIKLDLLSKKYEISRSETLRRLIRAKVEKLC